MSSRFTTTSEPLLLSPGLRCVVRRQTRCALNRRGGRGISGQRRTGFRGPRGVSAPQRHSLFAKLRALELDAPFLRPSADPTGVLDTSTREYALATVKEKSKRCGQN